MANISKQDLHGARTAADLERKYGTRFAEVMGVATGAREVAEGAAEATKNLDINLTQEEIFKRLTNNGEAHGVFRGEDGQIYINASYLQTGIIRSADGERTIIDLDNGIAYITGSLTTVEETDETGIRSISTVKPGAVFCYKFSPEGTCAARLLGDKIIVEGANDIVAEVSPNIVGISSENPVHPYLFARMSCDTDDGTFARLRGGEGATLLEIASTPNYGNYIGGLSAPSSPTMAANKAYVDDSMPVADEGYSGTWAYRKWKNGLAECWTKQTVTGAFTQQWGSMYCFSATPGKLTYPITFVESVPIETVTARASSSACFLFAESNGNGQNTKTTTANYNVARPSEVTEAQTVEYSYYVIGRWK